MSQGYVFFGIDDYGKTDNIDRAHALSHTLKMSDANRPTAVIVGSLDQVPQRLEGGFDYIVEIPWGRTEVNHHDFRIDWWQIYGATPFDQTMYLDTYSLIIDNIASLWDTSSNYELLFGQASDFRGNVSNNNQQSVIQDRNQIDFFNVGVIYFEKSLIASEFFKMADPIFKNWRTIYSDRLTEARATDFDFDLMVNIVAEYLGIRPDTDRLFDYTDLIIDPVWSRDSDEDVKKIQDRCNVWFTDDCELKINNYRQSGIVKYTDPEFLTQDMMTKINDHYRKTKNQIQN